MEDTRNSQCTTRTYGFTAASERTTFASYAAGANGACQTTTATVSRTNTYDTANRIRNTGYTYDDLGRTLTRPAADTAPGGVSALGSTYFANDMVASLSQSLDNGQGGSVEKQASYQLDPSGRINMVTNKTDGLETNRLRYRFAGTSDSPASIQSSTDAGASWTSTRYVSVPGVGMTGTATGSAITYQIANLHGDIVATQAYQAGVVAIDSYHESNEYGISIDGTTGRYGWLGSNQRSTDGVGGMTLMGARVYSPTTGRFLSPDSVDGGSPSPYLYPTNPLDDTDLNGQFWITGPFKHGMHKNYYIHFHKYGTRQFTRWTNRSGWGLGVIVLAMVYFDVITAGAGLIIEAILLGEWSWIMDVANNAVNNGTCLAFQVQQHNVVLGSVWTAKPMEMSCRRRGGWSPGMSLPG